MKFRSFLRAALIGLIALLGIPAVSLAQEKTALVVTPAPIYLLPDATRIPLHILESRSTVVVRKQLAEWVQAEFHDQRFGLRTGYVQAKYLVINQAERDTVAARATDLGLKRPVEAVQPNTPIAAASTRTPVDARTPAQATDLGLKGPAEAALPTTPTAAASTGAPVDARPASASTPSGRTPTAVAVAATDSPQPTPPAKATPPPSTRTHVTGADNSEKTVYVRENTRKDGTKVKAHMRRPPGAGSDRENKKSQNRKKK